MSTSSILVTQTISNGTVSTSSTDAIRGSALAWVNFNGTGTPAIRASYNVTAVSKITTGTYVFTMTNPMPDANYAVVACCGVTNQASFAAGYPRNSVVVNVTTVNVGTSASFFNDMSTVSVAVFR
jgi:hypothetical protein